MKTKARGGMGRVRLLGAVVLTALLVTACEDDAEPTGPTETIAELAASTAGLETLAAAVGAAGLGDALSGPGPFTVFAPANAAFEALPEGMLNALLEAEQADVLEELLLGHVVAGSVRASDLSDGQVLTTLSGDEVQVRIEAGEVWVGGARVVTADVAASNGVVHVLDGVLTGGLTIVERARVTPALSALVTAVTQAGLAETLQGEGSFTVFAPTNAAFEAIGPVPTDAATLQPILLYHVVGAEAFSTDLADGQVLTTLQGGTLTVQLDDGVMLDGARNAAGVTVTDVDTSNGVVHVIDSVLLPPS